MKSKIFLNILVYLTYSCFVAACKNSGKEFVERRTANGNIISGSTNSDGDLTAEEEAAVDNALDESAADNKISVEDAAGDVNTNALTVGQAFCNGASKIDINNPQLEIQRSRLCDKNGDLALLKQLTSANFAFEGMGMPNLVILDEKNLGGNRTLMEMAGSVRLNIKAKQASDSLFAQLLENGTRIDGMTKTSKLQGEEFRDDPKFYKAEIWKTTFEIKALFITLTQVMDVDLRKYNMFQNQLLDLIYQTEIIMNPNENINKMARTIGFIDGDDGESYFFFQMQIEMNNYGQHAQVFGNFQVTARQMIVDAWNLSNIIP